MEYAAGADHLIYGGVFYAIVLFLLILIGEKFRDKKTITNMKLKVVEKEFSYQYWPVSFLLVVIFSLQHFWISNIKSNHEPVENHSTLINIDSLRYDINQKKLVKWKPHFPDADILQQGHVNIDENTKIDFFSALYEGHKGELISSTNKFYYASRWSLVNTSTIRLNHRSKLVKLTHLVSPLGKHRWIIHWYILGDFNYINKVEIKLNQTFNLMIGRVDRSGVIAFSIESDRNDEAVLIQFLDIISNIDSVTKQVIDDK